jgi:hypothetical protein
MKLKIWHKPTWSNTWIALIVLVIFLYGTITNFSWILIIIDTIMIVLTFWTFKHHAQKEWFEVLEVERFEVI